MKRSPKLAISIVLLTIVFAWLGHEPDSNIKFFCSNGRVFIEFKEGNSIWGTAWTDDNGRPMSCSEINMPKTQASSIIKDI